MLAASRGPAKPHISGHQSTGGGTLKTDWKQKRKHEQFSPNTSAKARTAPDGVAVDVDVDVHKERTLEDKTLTETGIDIN